MVKFFLIANFLAFSLIVNSCVSKSKATENQNSIHLILNYEASINKNGVNEKKILNLWSDYLNSGDNSYFDSLSVSHWSTSTDFPIPNHFLSGIAQNAKDLANTQVTILALYPINDSSYAIKTAFIVQSKIMKQIILNHICTVYAVPKQDKFKLLSSPQWYAQKWDITRLGDVTFYHPPERKIDTQTAFKLDSFNKSISFKFKTEPIKFKYFTCINNMEVYKLMGYDYSPDQYVQHPEGAICSPENNTIIAGNNTEYYPHEVVHLYTGAFWGKNGNYYHRWFDEGIATLFGGSMGYPLEWHLQKLKKFLELNPNFKITNLQELNLVPDGTFRTHYVYSIGGLLCKLIYEKHSMNGLFDVLKSGHTDEDFFNTVERYFGVKKSGFTDFIRRELEKLPEPEN